MLMVLSSSFYPIFSIQITGKYICEFFASPWQNLIINPHVEHNTSQIYLNKFAFPHEKLFSFS